jgi:predicted DNA-binding transcriptional regulator AlpA
MTENRLVSTREVADRLGESVRTIHRKAKSGEYPAQQMPGTRGAFVFTEETVRALEAARSTPAA